MDMMITNHGQPPVTAMNLDVKMRGVVGYSETVFVALLTSKAVTQSSTAYPCKPLVAEVALHRSTWGEPPSWNRELLIHFPYCCRDRNCACVADARYEENCAFTVHDETRN